MDRKMLVNATNGKVPRNSPAKFSPGLVCITPAAAQVVAPNEVGAALLRHLCGDWGDVGPDDWQANERAPRRRPPPVRLPHRRERRLLADHRG